MPARLARAAKAGAVYDPVATQEKPMNTPISEMRELRQV